MLRILAWNLNHRKTMKAIPHETVSAIYKLDVDLVILNEYTDGDRREPFKESLRDIGFSNILISQKIGRSNQVLIASKLDLEAGKLAAPTIGDSSRTNFLHVVLPSIGLNVVGLRCPMIKPRRDLNSYWDELRTIIDTTGLDPVVFIGDFNGDPDGKKSPAGTHLSELRANGWHVPAPVGDWSYISFDGSKRSRLDHVAGSPNIKVTAANYVTRVDETLLAGLSSEKPISDHAALVVEIGISHPCRAVAP